jgi:hypothetical protein
MPKARNRKPRAESPPPTPQATEPAPRAFLLFPILALGLVLWIWPMQAQFGGLQHALLAAVVLACCCIPALARRINLLFLRIRDLDSTTAWRTAAIISVAASIYLFATAWWQGTDLVPKVVDESSYLIQIRMLASGRLWMGPHPPEIRPFFEAFNLLVEPKYGSMYFPGTALLYVPTAWLGLPFWTMPLAASAACVGLFYRLVYELIDGVYAAVAVIALLGLTKFRALSLMLFSQTPMLLFGLLLMLAYLRWRRGPSWRWAAVIGGLAGWAGITRPADALCYALPIGLAMLLDLRRPPRDDDAKNRASLPRRVAAMLGALVFAAAPFLGLQVVQNIGMTGHWWEFPEARYADETYPAPMLGFHNYDAAALRRPSLVQKRELNERMVAYLYEAHQPSQIVPVWWRVRLPETLQFSLPHPFFAVFLPVGILALRDRRRRVLAAVPLCFIAFYVFYVFYIPHYLVVMAPAMIVLALLGFRAAGEAVGRINPKLAGSAGAAAILLPAALALGSFPELDRHVHDEDLFGPQFFHDESPAADAQLAQLSSELGPEGKALVLFRYDPNRNVPDEELVYNTDVAWPDDATIIRAHDRGPANPVLFRYYAQVRHEPNRQVYLYDRPTRKLNYIGTVGALRAQQPHTNPS